jgi:hypothetical protein
MATKPQFTKIVANQKHVALHWSSRKKSADDVEEITSHELQCQAKPRPSFDTALQAFKPFLLKILGAPASWSEGTTVTGISLNKEEDGRRGVVITASRKCPHGAAPIAINTPHLREPIDDKDAGSSFFLEGMADAIDVMYQEAQKYLEGDRQQGELFTDDAAKKGKRGGKPTLVGEVLAGAGA